MVVLYILIGFACTWLMIHGLVVVKGKYYAAGTLWGCPFKGKGDKVGWLMAGGGLLLLIVWMILMIAHEDSWRYLWQSMVAMLAGMGFSFYSWVLARNKCYASNNISSAIVNVPFMPALDHYSARCHHFELGYNGIAFYDEANYCFGTILFADYRMGDLEGKQMLYALNGLAQRFHGVFKAKVEDRDGARHYVFVRK